MSILESFDLSGKTALVTGCKRGIGRAMAEALAGAGADIIGVSASLEAEGSAVEQAVRAMGRRFEAHQCDFADRDAVREIMGDGDFIEAYVQASVETCEGRDVKGLYKKARAGEIPEFTGISAPYEEPNAPEVVLDTNTQSVDESVAALVAHLEKNGFLG